MSHDKEHVSAKGAEAKETSPPKKQLKPMPPIPPRTSSKPSAVFGGPIQAKGDLRAGQVPAPASGGEPLPTPVRQKMESSLGGDLSDVRVHQGPHVAKLGARAYTQGKEVHFAPGQYQPNTTGGQQLLGHELAHVIQQRAGRVSGLQGKGGRIVQDPDLEREADAAGVAVVRGQRAAIAGVSTATQLKEDDSPIQLEGNTTTTQTREQAAGETSSQTSSQTPETSEAGVCEQTEEQEDEEERREVDEFVASEHCVQNFAMGGSGNFDLDYDPQTGLATVEVRLGFEFEMGPIGDAIAALFDDETEVADYFWNEEEQATYKAEFMSQVQSTWSGQHAFQCTREDGTLRESPKWSEFIANVTISIVEDEENPHFNVQVQRIPEAAFETSSVTAPRRNAAGEVTRAGSSQLDSNDITGVQKQSGSAGTTQRASVHEFGHMLGLQDEYPGTGRASGTETRQGSTVGEGRNDDRIMAGGEIVEQAHYESIKQALESATAPATWAFA